MPASFGDQRCRVVGMAQHDHHADEVRSAFCFRNALQCTEQLGDIGRTVAMLARIARRPQSGCAVQGIHANAGIIAHCGQAGDPRGVACLEDRVLDKCRAGFLDIDNAKLALGDEFNVEAGEDFPHLHELAAVAAGEHQFHGWPGPIRSQRLP